MGAVQKLNLSTPDFMKQHFMSGWHSRQTDVGMQFPFKVSKKCHLQL